MKALITAVAAAAILAGAATSINAQPRGDHGNWGQDQGAGHHWRNGEHMGRSDWSGAQTVDYRQHHLRAPPRGYEWRESNGQFILGAIATGLIASAIVDSGR